MNTFKVIIAGARTYNDYEQLQLACRFHLTDSNFRTSPYTIEIVSGGATGADALGELYAKQNNHILTKFPANWKEHGLNAGPIRNLEMAKYADALIAFPVGKSSGTRNMIRVARIHQSLPVIYGANHLAHRALHSLYIDQEQAGSIALALATDNAWRANRALNALDAQMESIRTSTIT